MSQRTFLTFIAGVTLALAVPVFGQSYSSSFPDVRSSDYFFDAATHMSGLGVIRGYPTGFFGPHDTVTRAQVAVMFDRYDQTVVQPLRDQIAAIHAKIGISGNVCGTHDIGDSYPSTDGCNSCSCTLKGEICTLRACTNSSRSSMVSRSSASSRTSIAPACGNGKCEQGEETNCPSQDCQSGEACPLYCIAGNCPRDCTASSASSRSSSVNQCAPYVCKDGTMIPSCTIDGHVINYFAAPCMTHGGDMPQ